MIYANWIIRKELWTKEKYVKAIEHGLIHNILILVEDVLIRGGREVLELVTIWIGHKIKFWKVWSGFWSIGIY